jgi:pimeloyl-ACP methyl ester carboxylesterase
VRAVELRDAGALTGTALSEVAVVARDVHRAIARRVFRTLGASAEPVQRIHDGIAAVAYGSTQVGLALIPPVVGSAVAAFTTDTGSAHDGRTGRFVLGALSGFWGDRMATKHASLATPMSLRTHGGDRRRRAQDLVADLTEPTGRIAVFVHGLCESDQSWWLAATRHWGDADTTYGSLLAAEQGWTPLYLAYNTGLHISTNGRALSQLLDELVLVWPVGIDEIALIGHSMGGLVARSACHVAEADGSSWVRSTRHIVCLATPHLGAPLERAVNAGTHALRKFPETQPFATWLDRRSVGIKDLRYGALVDGDWLDIDPDEFLRNRCSEVPFSPGVIYYYIGVTLTKQPTGPVSRLMGDLLVQYPSASGAGRRRRLPFEIEHGRHIGGLHHLDLLNNPEVYRQLATWIGASVAQ